MVHHRVEYYSALKRKDILIPAARLNLGDVILKGREIGNFFLKYFTYLFLERGEGSKKEMERNIHVWLPLMCPLQGTWPATQACVLTGN